MPTENWIQTPQGQIYAAEWSANDTTSLAPIILFHDSLGCVALWRDFPAQLAQITGRRVIAYDRLGFGQSDPYPGPLPLSFVSDEASGTFQTLYQARELEQFIAFGHSVGGGMAIACASSFQEQCLALITESAQTFVEDRTLAGIQQAQALFSDLKQRARLKKYHGDKAEWVLNAWINTWLSEGFCNWNLDQELDRITSPLLALHGDQDEYGSSAHPERMLAHTKGSAVMKILPNCGHVPHREQSNTVLKLIQDFLASLPANNAQPDKN